MPDINLHITGDSTEATEALNQLAEKLGSAGEASESMTSSIFKAEAAVEVLKEGFAKLKEFTSEAIGLALKQDEVDQQLAGTIKTMGFNANEMLPALKGMNEGFKEQSTATDEQLEQMEKLMLTFGVAPKDIQSTITAILDYAGRMHVDAVQATEEFMRGVDNGGRGLRAFGVHIKATGDRTTDLKAATGQLEERFRGGMQSATEGLSGTFSTMKRDFEELTKAFGQFITQSSIGQSIIHTLSETMKGMAYALSDENKAEQQGRDLIKQRNAMLGERITLVNQIKKAQEDFNEAEKSSWRSSEDAKGTLDRLNQVLGALDNEIAKNKAAFQAWNEEQKKSEETAKQQLAQGHSTVHSHEKTAEALRQETEEQRKATEERRKAIKEDQLAALGLDEYSLAEQKWAEKSDKELEDWAKNVSKQSKKAADDLFNNMDQAAKAVERIEEDMAKKQAEIVKKAEEAGVKAGEAFERALGEQLKSVTHGGSFDVVALLKSALPAIVDAALMMVPGMQPFAPLVGGAISALVGMFHDGGWAGGVQHFASGGYVQDTVPAMLAPGERVLSHQEIDNMGGAGMVDSMARGGSGPTATYYINALDSLSFADFMRHQGGDGMTASVRAGGGSFSTRLRRAGVH